MATKAQAIEFINMIAPLAQKAFKTLGKVRPSVCIGMACLESGFGQSKIMAQHNSYMGHKVGSGKTATKYWQGDFFVSKTKEEYQIGVHTVIKSAFRSFPTAEMCILNFYELLNTSLYSKVKAGASYIEQMQQIKACGYMTSSTEVDSVCKIIEKYKLTRYDFEDAPAVQIAVKNPYHLYINKGTEGECVKWLQFELNRNGADLKIDGIFQNRTFAAVCQFQRENGLSVDGIAGSKTINKLKEYI